MTAGRIQIDGLLRDGRLAAVAQLHLLLREAEALRIVVGIAARLAELARRRRRLAFQLDIPAEVEVEEVEVKAEVE